MMRQNIRTGLNKAKYMALGSLLTLTVIGIYSTVIRMDALVQAWNHPKEVSALEITVTQEVTKK